MQKPLSHLASAALALAAALAAAPRPAAGAQAQGQATAVIVSAVSVRQGEGPQSTPLVRTVMVDQPSPKMVVRPCRPGEPAVEQCRLLLVELQ